MPEKNKRHLTLEMREVVQAGLEERASARKISKRIGVSPSTVTREIKANRTLKERRAWANARLSVRCARHRDCDRSGFACEKCSTRLTMRKSCRTRDCTRSCPDFARAMCPTTEKWPYVCPASCPKKSHCGYPRASYSALSAHAPSAKRLSESRSGIGICEEELKAMDDLIAPLVRRSQSFEAIWALHADEAFEAAIPVLLVDRGCEFDDWEDMERSCLAPAAAAHYTATLWTPTRNRNASATTSSSAAYCPRRGATSTSWAPTSSRCARATSTPTPLPGARGGCAFGLASGYFPPSVLSFLGLRQLDPDEMVLKPYLMPHVVRQ